MLYISWYLTNIIDVVPHAVFVYYLFIENIYPPVDIYLTVVWSKMSFMLTQLFSSKQSCLSCCSRHRARARGFLCLRTLLSWVQLVLLTACSAAERTKWPKRKYNPFIYFHFIYSYLAVEKKRFFFIFYLLCI